MKNIARITARSGSKGLPHKNIKMLNGKPLMAWSIKAALDSGMFDTVMVSTDSEEYARIAREYGAEVPFLRSEATSGDNSSSWDTVAEVIDNYRKLGREFDTLALLQPTSPLRKGEDIKGAYRLLDEREGANAVVSFTEYDFSPLLGSAFDDSWSFDENKRISMMKVFRGAIDQNAYYKRQSLPTFYHANGAIYIVKVKKFEENHYFYDETCYAYLMSQENSIDVDTELDFVIAEAVMKHFGNY